MLHLEFADEVPGEEAMWIFNVAAGLRIDVVFGDQRFEIGDPFTGDRFVKISGSEFAGCLTAEFGDSKVTFRSGAALTVEAMLVLAAVHPSKS